MQFLEVHLLNGSVCKYLLNQFVNFFKKICKFLAGVLVPPRANGKRATLYSGHSSPSISRCLPAPSSHVICHFHIPMWRNVLTVMLQQRWQAAAGTASTIRLLSRASLWALHAPLCFAPRQILRLIRMTIRIWTTSPVLECLLTMMIKMKAAPSYPRIPRRSPTASRPRKCTKTAHFPCAAAPTIHAMAVAQLKEH